MGFVKRSPDYRVKVRRNCEQAGNEVGKAWMNENGNLSIVMNVGCYIDDTMQVTMFPVDQVKEDAKIG